MLFRSQGSKYFDYLKGRVMKLDLTSDDEFDPWGYDRDNGRGAAQNVIDALRESGTQAVEIQAAHEIGKQASAERTLVDIHKPTTFADGVYTLGLDDVAEPLEKAIRKATEAEERT